jgi:gliding motility-associated-like protein
MKLFFTSLAICLALSAMAQAKKTNPVKAPVKKATTSTVKKTTHAPAPAGAKVADCEIWHGPAFSPNGDGKDDVFSPNFINCVGTQIEFWVVSSSGTVVFKTSDLTKTWDGNYNGKPQPAGTYMWQYKMLRSKGGWMNSMGKINLVRR